jgi:hypothetical protein
VCTPEECCRFLRGIGADILILKKGDYRIGSGLFTEKQYIKEQYSIVIQGLNDSTNFFYIK